MQAFPDNAARREVEALAAVCPNEGCTWTGTIKEFEVHFNAKQTHNSESNVHLFSCLQVIFVHSNVFVKMSLCNHLYY